MNRNGAMRAAAVLGALLAVPLLASGQAGQTNIPQDESGQSLHPQAAQVGAGTTSGATTGSSGPKQGGGKGPPPLPQASLCKDYQGDVHESCMHTVLRAKPRAEGQASAPSGSSGEGR